MSAGTSAHAAARGLLAAIEVARSFHPEMMTVDLAVMLHVYAKGPGGVTQVDLRTKMGMEPAHITRVVARLSEWERPLTKKGHALLFNEIDPSHRSRRILTLTAKGERLVGQILAATE